METYVILTKLSPDAFGDLGGLVTLAREVSDRIKSECPEVIWKGSYALMGRFDVLDIIEAPNREAAERAAMIIRAFGHGTTETLPATPWHQFMEMIETHQQVQTRWRG